MQIKKNQTRSYKIQNCSFIAILFTVMLTGLTADTAITKPGFDPSKVKIKAIKYHSEGKQDRVIYEGNLYIAALSGAFYEATWDRVYQNSANYSHIITLVDASGVKETAVAQYKLQLPGAENCSGDEYVEVTVRVQNDVADATVDDTVSYIEISEERVVANPSTKYTIENYIIDTTETEFRKRLGNNVKRILFLNTNKTGILTADAMFTSVNVSTDRLNFTKSYERMLCEREEMFATKTQAEDRDQSFVILDAKDGEFDDVDITIDMVNANITQGKNWLVVEKWDTDSITVMKHKNRASKHGAKIQRKFSVLANRK